MEPGAGAQGNVNIIFASRISKDSRPALEKLLFFNPRQHKVREGIIHSLQQFGHPRVVESADGLSVRVGEHEAQTLFAFDRERKSPAPVGVIVFLRTSPPEISIMHVAVAKKYALRGREAGVGLGVALVEKVKEIASRIVGVDRVLFFYRREVVLRLNGHALCATR